MSMCLSIQFRLVSGRRNQVSRLVLDTVLSKLTCHLQPDTMSHKPLNRTCSTLKCQLSGCGSSAKHITLAPAQNRRRFSSRRARTRHCACCYGADLLRLKSLWRAYHLVLGRSACYLRIVCAQNLVSCICKFSKSRRGTCCNVAVLLHARRSACPPTHIKSQLCWHGKHRSNTGLCTGRSERLGLGPKKDLDKEEALEIQLKVQLLLLSAAVLA
jgi:hypothetical protein